MVADERRAQRAERILDVAAELILSWGSRRVTIDEVAKRAGVGKGTVYLHWKTRDALFHGVVLRESVAVLDRLIAAMRADGAEILPHRLASRTFSLSMRHPLLVALLTRDADVLDRLVEHDPAETEARLRETRDYLEILRAHRLIRTDVALDAQLYTMQVVTSGASLVEPWLPAALDLDLDAKADTVAQVIRASIGLAEPPDPAALRAAAPLVIARFEELRTRYAAVVHDGAAAEVSHTGSN
ncbi:MAG: helix-turn-helix domain-containing protein [Actinocatenispora sp.]